MPGNTLGQRGYYIYETDTADIHSYLTDRDLGAAVNAVLGDTDPPFPRRFSPRGVHVQATIAGKIVRKFLICPQPTNALFASSSSQTVTIDGTAFKTTGRRGESQSFGSNT